VERAVRIVNIPELFAVEPFDRWRPDPSRIQICVGDFADVSVCERTLTDDEVENFNKAILNTLKQRMDAELRQ
jgi:phenylalanyl-tRNA synthetase beta subunit